MGKHYKLREAPLRPMGFGFMCELFHAFHPLLQGKTSVFLLWERSKQLPSAESCAFLIECLQEADFFAMFRS